MMSGDYLPVQFIPHATRAHSVEKLLKDISILANVKIRRSVNQLGRFNLFLSVDLKGVKRIWLLFGVLAVVGFAFSTLTSEIRQEVAMYIIICFIAAVIIRPVGLTIGNFLRKLFEKD
jgi:hypothetical protein